MTSVRIPINLRWGDLDAYGHVNNATVMRLLEEARTRGFWRRSDDAEESGIFPPLDADSPIWSVVSEMQIRYLRQIDYQTAPIMVEMTVSRVAGASLDIDYQMFSGDDDRPLVTARSTIVTVDRSTGRPCRLPAQMRDALRRFTPS